VNAEQASSEYQPKGVQGGRADHATAKATDNGPNPKWTLDALGVLAAARCDGMVGNTRGPPWRPTSGKDHAYKGETESAGSQEGVRGVRSTCEGGEKPLEGRDPALSVLGRGGKREGMVERPNNPEEKVRELQRRLWTCAKRSRSRRFHALYDRIWRGDVLLEAWRRVKANGGAAGVDEVSIGDIE